LFCTGDFLEDFARGFGRDEGLWIGIVVLEVFQNDAFELWDAFEDAAANALASDLGEEAPEEVLVVIQRWGHRRVPERLGAPCRDGL
jgi:hypothetical protein